MLIRHLSSRLLLTAAASVAALTAVPATAHADTGPTRIPPSPYGSLDGWGGGALGTVGGDHLTVSVVDAGAGKDGTYDLRCHPDRGTHADPAGACKRLDELADDDQDPFAPVPKGTYCTMQYGGNATAHITGTWHGHRVDSSYKLTDGCEISRWRRMVPVLPATTP
ncbi:SSI family serine proteinase inhibitor [Streptomyces sp. NPDC006552]|uniref:SSI family serine proteinase inhibitor n=1 Tax=Streptomyces sp. NPDC006552 TaxID=3157179 RepID=UPI0033B8875B